jgi:hypothetical protein
LKATIFKALAFTADLKTTIENSYNDIMLNPPPPPTPSTLSADDFVQSLWKIKV